MAGSQLPGEVPLLFAAGKAQSELSNPEKSLVGERRSVN